VTRRQPERGPDDVAQRLRVRYARRGRMRFTSHRDVQRALERALRQAEVPVAFSGGFTRHPRISYVGGAPTGTCSEAEYLEIGLTAARDPDRLARELDAALPEGLDVVEVVEARTPGFAERCAASRWRIELGGVAAEEAAAALRAFLAVESLPVDRLTPQGRRTVDARAAVVAARVAAGAGAGAAAGVGVGVAAGVAAGAAPAPADPPGAALGGAKGACAIIDVVVRHTTPAVRPDDVLAGLARTAGLEPVAPPRVTRLAQGPLQAPDVLADPLAPDRAAPAAEGGSHPERGSTVAAGVPHLGRPR
jgi:radical SAM-linked protein